MGRKAKQQQAFDLKGLGEQRTRLLANRDRIIQIIRDNLEKKIDFGIASTMRDAANYLLTTEMVIQMIDETVRPLVEMSGEPQAIPNLDKCGLDWNPDDDD